MTKAELFEALWKLGTGVVLPALLAYLGRKYKHVSDWRELQGIFEEAWRHVEVWKSLKGAADGKRPSSGEAEDEFMKELRVWRRIRKQPPLSQKHERAARYWAKLRSEGAKLDLLNGHTPPHGTRRIGGK